MHFPLFVSRPRGEHVEEFFGVTALEMKETFRLGVADKGDEWDLLRSEMGISFPIGTNLELQEGGSAFPSMHSTCSNDFVIS